IGATEDAAARSVIAGQKPEGTAGRVTCSGRHRRGGRERGGGRPRAPVARPAGRASSAPRQRGAGAPRGGRAPKTGRRRVGAAPRGMERHRLVKVPVNNAGVPGRATFLDGDPERIEQVVRTNYLGGVWCLRAFLPALEAARPSDVVNVVSVAGTVAFPPSGPY